MHIKYDDHVARLCMLENDIQLKLQDELNNNEGLFEYNGVVN